MTYRGIVRQGKVELEPGTRLCEGARVRVDTDDADWRTEWERLAQEITERWQAPQSALECLRESRR